MTGTNMKRIECLHALAPLLVVLGELVGISCAKRFGMQTHRFKSQRFVLLPIVGLDAADVTHKTSQLVPFFGCDVYKSNDVADQSNFHILAFVHWDRDDSPRCWMLHPHMPPAGVWSFKA